MSSAAFPGSNWKRRAASSSLRSNGAQSTPAWSNSSASLRPRWIKAAVGYSGGASGGLRDFAVDHWLMLL